MYLIAIPYRRERVSGIPGWIILNLIGIWPLGGARRLTFYVIPKTPFLIRGSVLCPTNTVVRSFFGPAMLCSFCSPETQHFQKNNSFHFFTQKISEISEVWELIIPMNSNKTTIFASWISRKKWKTIIFWKCWVSGLQNEHNIACPKNDLTTVFLAQSTDPPIKNGVEVINRKHLAIAHVTETMVTWNTFDYIPQRGDSLILYDYLFQQETGTKPPEKRPGMEIYEDDPWHISNTVFLPWLWKLI